MKRILYLNSLTLIEIILRILFFITEKSQKSIFKSKPKPEYLKARYQNQNR